MNVPVNTEIDRLLLEKGIDVPVQATIADVVMKLYAKYGIWIYVKPTNHFWMYTTVLMLIYEGCISNLKSNT